MPRIPEDLARRKAALNHESGSVIMLIVLPPQARHRFETTCIRVLLTETNNTPHPGQRKTVAAISSCSNALAGMTWTCCGMPSPGSGNAVSPYRQVVSSVTSSGLSCRGDGVTWAGVPCKYLMR